MPASFGVLPEPNSLVVVHDVIGDNHVVGGAGSIAGRVASSNEDTYIVVKNSVVADAVVGGCMPGADALGGIAIADIVDGIVERRCQIDSMILVAASGSACTNVMHHVGDNFHVAAGVVALLDPAGAVA